MIGKVTLGNGFQGLQAYLLSGKDGHQLDRVAWVATRNLPSEEPELAAPVMRATAAQSSRVERPVYHLTISVSPEEKLDREAILRVADRTLRDLGLADHQVLIVAHRDTDHQHVHLMVNRVHPETRRAWHAGHDYARIEKSLRLQEREMGLRHVPGRHFALPGHERHRAVDLSGGDRRLPGRTGERPFSEHVRAVVRQDLRGARSWEELHRRLAEYGLRLEKRGRGIVITDGERRVKASFVDRRSSLSQLEKRLGRYEPQRDFPAGKSGLWRDIQAIRQTADDLARLQKGEEHRREQSSARLDQRRASQELVRLEQRAVAASRSLDDHFKTLYRDASAARQAFDDHAAQRGIEVAARELASKPQRFGSLRGRGPSLISATRRQTKLSIDRAVSAARGLAAAQLAVAKHVPLIRPVARLVDSAKRARFTPSRNRTSPELARTAAKLAQRLGWKMVAKVVPIPHFQLLRLTVSLSRKALGMAIDLGKGAQR